MKFKFPLQAVLKHRKILENLAQKDFSQVQALLLEEELHLQHLESQLHESFMTAGVASKAGGMLSAKLDQITEFKKLQGVLIINQKKRVQEVQNMVEAKREILRAAAVEYKIMERLREKKFEEFKHSMQIEEQKELDELSILRFEKDDIS